MEKKVVVVEEFDLLECSYFFIFIRVYCAVIVYELNTIYILVIVFLFEFLYHRHLADIDVFDCDD